MARIRSHTAGGVTLDTGRGTMPRVQTSGINAIAQGGQAIANAIGNHGARLEAQKKTRENFINETRFVQTVGSIDEDLQKRSQETDLSAPPQHDDVIKKFDEKTREFLSSLPDEQHDAYQIKFEKMRNDLSHKAAKNDYDRTQKFYKTEVGKTLDKLAINSSRTPANVDANFKVGLDKIHSSGLPQSQKETMSSEWWAQNYVSAVQTDPEKAKQFVSPQTTSGSLIKRFEGYISTAKWDVNHERVGYGSETITKVDGRVVRVTKGMKITKADAERDLQRRIGIYNNTLANKMGAEKWQSFNPAQQEVFRSLVHNYGSLPDRVLRVVKRGGSQGEIGAAIQDLESDNDWINAPRRSAEAEIFLGQAPAPVSKDDPRLGTAPPEYVSQDDYNRVLNASFKAVAGAEKAQGEQNAWSISQLEIGISRGTAGHEDIENFKESGILDDPKKYTSLIKEADKNVMSKHKQKENDILINQVMASKDVNLDPANKEQKSVANDYFNRNVLKPVEGQSPEEARLNYEQKTAGFVNSTKVVPDAVKSQFNAAIVGDNLEAQVSAVNLFDMIQFDSPATASQIPEKNRRFLQLSSKLIQSGNDPKKAVELAKKEIFEPSDTVRQARAKQLPELNKDIAKEFKKEIDVDGGWFADSVDGGLSSSHAVTKMEGEFLTNFEKEFLATGDENLAYESAKETTFRVWGETNINNRRAYMKFAPEKEYGDPSLTIEENSKWITDELKKEVNEHVGDTLSGWDYGSNAFLISDGKTSRKDAGGSRSYLVMVRDANGFERPLMNHKTNTPMRWHPPKFNASEKGKLNEIEVQAEVEHYRNLNKNGRAITPAEKHFGFGVN